LDKEKLEGTGEAEDPPPPTPLQDRERLLTQLGSPDCVNKTDKLCKTLPKPL
jgi:hypothetical protein